MLSKFVSFNKQEIESLLELDLPPKVRKRLERALKPIKVRSGKAKGLSFQKKIGQDIADMLDVDFGMEDDSTVSSRPGGQHGVDIILRGEASKLFPFSIECKKQETLNVVNSIEQAKSNQDGKDWLVICENKRIKPPIVILDWKVLLRLIKKSL